MLKKVFIKSLAGLTCFATIAGSFTVGLTSVSATSADDYIYSEDPGDYACFTREADFYTDKEPVSDYAYSFAVIGDQQCVTNFNPDNLHYIYDYILDNKEEKKIEYVFNLGDITENSKDWEWETSMAQFARLDGVIPYSAVRGNHDTTATYEGYLGASEAYKSQFIGFYREGEVQSAYRTLTVGKTDYLILNLGYGASDALLQWAGSVVSKYPDHKVIMTTHGYLNPNGTYFTSSVFQSAREEYNAGQAIWDKFVSRYENIVLVMSGHCSTSTITVKKAMGVHGNTVTQVLIDPQWEDMIYKESGGLGMVAMLYFSEDGMQVDVEYYSTIRQAYYKPENQFSISLAEEKVEETHICEPSVEWVKNATHHWNICMVESCSGELNKAAHTFGEWKETLAPTKGAEGRKERVCTTCNYTESTSVPLKTSGCSSSIGGLGIGVGAVALLGAAYVSKRKKIKK